SVPLAAALAARGATAATVGGLLAMTAQGVLGRLLALLVREFGPPPGRWCWLALGPAGRREMLPGQGLSLAVVSDCGGDDILARAMDTYCRGVFPVLADRLKACGLGGAELAGPVDMAGLGAFLQAGPYGARLDARVAAGDAGLGEDVRCVLAGCRPEPALLASWLADRLARPAPLGIHQGRLAERQGGFAAVFDVAERGSRPVVAMARLAGLLWGAPGPGTVSRLQALAAAGHLPGPVVQHVLDAFAFFEGERLLARLAGQAGDPDVVSRPGALSARRRQEYRAAFGAVEALRLALLAGFGAGEGR
ncbi:putative nucleotidyltransferase substrate binding domain-containing protein, partial [Desulfovibrio sp. DV]|uniref:putative nucleotidyltransferase substrate binding domain-containing protein n=1 Tax=Desulfovibrio sp. DV TaxID=1844708 RepID=UPI000A9EA643